MVFRKLFGKKADEEQQKYTIDDLIVLERWDDAEAKLRERMKYRNDLHDHLKLADILVGKQEVAKAVGTYLFVAEQYAADGFHDRAIAALVKAKRLDPMDESIPQTIEKFEELKRLERSRQAAMEGFLAGQEGKEGHGTAVMEFQAVWRAIGKSKLVRALSEDQIRLMFLGVDLVSLAPGQGVASRGSRDEALYVISTGELVASVIAPTGDQTDLRTFGTGQVIGDSALLEHRPWPADFRARTRSIVLKLDPQGLEVCLTGNPDPRGFLEVLRREHNDQAVLHMVASMEHR